MSASARDRCHFLELPPELRNHMYQLVVIDDDRINMRVRFWNADGSPNVQLRQPSLAATCRQIRAEALSMFYSCNISSHAIEIGSCIDDLESFTCCLDLMGLQNCRSLTRVDVTFSYLSQTSWMDLLRWVRFFCRESECVPQPGVLELKAVSHLGFQNSWSTALMRDVESLGRSLVEGDGTVPTTISLKREILAKLMGLDRAEYK